MPARVTVTFAALLRREGLYSSLLSSWRRQRDEIAKVGMTSRKRGRKAKAEDPRVKELERENARAPTSPGSSMISRDAVLSAMLAGLTHLVPDVQGYLRVHANILILKEVRRHRQGQLTLVPCIRNN